MSIYDVIDKAGHNFTILAGPLAGKTYYWCEGCGAILRVRRGLAEDAIFQAPKGSLSTLQECSQQADRSTPFKEAMGKQDEEEYERMRQDAIGLPPGVNFGDK